MRAAIKAAAKRLIRGSKYNLWHLTQATDQAVSGPIQDDEALFLFALIRTARLHRILEFGGLDGYSATNFLAAVGESGVVYTLDINRVPKRATNHIPIESDAALVSAAHLDAKPVDMVFFDCHVYEAQMEAFRRLTREGIITDRTVIALHDTGLHPVQVVDWAYPVDGGWVHQPVERRMVNEFKALGYDALTLDVLPQNLGDLRYRQGITVMQKFRPMVV